MKICYFFWKSKDHLGGPKMVFTLQAFSKSQRVNTTNLKVASTLELVWNIKISYIMKGLYLRSTAHVAIIHKTCEEFAENLGWTNLLPN